MILHYIVLNVNFTLFILYNIIKVRFVIFKTSYLNITIRKERKNYINESEIPLNKLS